jgi:hypothetical protein
MQCILFLHNQELQKKKNKIAIRLGYLEPILFSGLFSLIPYLVFCRCDVTVWNRTKSKCDPLISLGAK